MSLNSPTLSNPPEPPGCWASFWTLIYSLFSHLRKPAALRRLRQRHAHDQALNSRLLQNNPVLVTYDFGNGDDELEWDDEYHMLIGGSLSLQSIAPVDPARLARLRYAAYTSPPPPPPPPVLRQEQRYGATNDDSASSSSTAMVDLLMRESYIEQRIQGVSDITGVKRDEILGSSSSSTGSDGGFGRRDLRDHGISGSSKTESTQSTTCYRSALDEGGGSS